MTLYLVRHADAGSRRNWGGDDMIRPLTSEGRHQAADIAGLLVDFGVNRFLSSPYRRCIETIVPAAAARGVQTEITEALTEGPHDDAVRLVRSLAQATVAFCSHGDIIPGVLDVLATEDGLDLGKQPRCQKGSIWVLEPKAGKQGKFALATYIPPTR